MRRSLSVLALLAGLFPAALVQGAQAAPAPCIPFSGFPLSLNLGTGLNTGDGETVRCSLGKIQLLLNNIRPDQAAITGGAINGAIIGASSAAAGTFTALKASSLAGNATASTVGTDAYASGYATGMAGFAAINTDTSLGGGKERYGLFGSYNGPGTGDPSVISTSFGVGAAALKTNWGSSTVPGQMVGANITARGGYHGYDANAALPQFGGYNPAGDVSGLVVNTVQSSVYGQNAVLEGVAYFAQNGAFDASGNVHAINVQLGTMRQLSPDGSIANPGIGLALSATGGGLGYAIQANNTARPGTYSYVPGSWGGFLRYNYDDGTHSPYDAFRVDQDGSIRLSASGGATPSKRIRAWTDGTLQILNSQDQPVAWIDEAGTIYLGSAAHVVINNKPVLGQQQAAVNDATGTGDVVATVNSLLAKLRAHGLIASQ